MRTAQMDKEAHMANYHEIPKPPRPKGSEEEYRTQIYNYLYRLAETLQAVVNGLQAMHEEGGKADG